MSATPGFGVDEYNLINSINLNPSQLHSIDLGQLYKSNNEQHTPLNLSKEKTVLTRNQ
ncbi:MAG TPA: hypothetical protein V6D26_14745 [Stenomitos sp.]